MQEVVIVAASLCSILVFEKGSLVNLEPTDWLEWVPFELQGWACLCQLRAGAVDVMLAQL